MARNLTHLMEQTGWSFATVAEKTGGAVAPKTVWNMANGVGACGIDAAQKVGAVFGLRGWHMISPELITDLTTSGTIRKLFEDYMKSDEEGRRHIEKVAERQADYHRPEHDDDDGNTPTTPAPKVRGVRARSKRKS